MSDLRAAEVGELGREAPAARARRVAAERERLGVGPQAHREKLTEAVSVPGTAGGLRVSGRRRHRRARQKAARSGTGSRENSKKYFWNSEAGLHFCLIIGEATNVWPY